MRILNITLRGFRGTIDRTVHFAEDGVTIIEGPNEVGKSSLAEALDLIFKLLDSSKSADITKVRPVDRDAGPEVEVELVTGPYELTYRKRWIKSPETVLTVRAPRGESLTGREAHERMLAILDETLDRQLWEALRYEQGTSISQSQIGSSQSLASALDAAAGGAGSSAGSGESRLWDRVEAERRQYVTATGRTSKARADLEADVVAAREAVGLIQGQIDEVSSAASALVDRNARRAELAAKLEEHGASLGDLKAAHEEAKAKLASLERLQGTERERRSDLERVKLEVASRARLRDEVERTSEKAAASEPELEAATALLGKAKEAAKEAEARRDEASSRLGQLEALQVIADRDLRHFEAMAELEGLDAKLERADDAEARLRSATSDLREIVALPEHADRAEGLDRAIERLRATLEAESPPVTVRARSTVQLEVDGSALPLEAGEERALSVGEGLTIAIPEVLEITIGSTEASGAMVSDLEEAQAELASVLAAAGLGPEGGLAQLRALLSRRDDLIASQRQAEGALSEIVGDGSIAQIRARKQDLEGVIASHLGERPTEPAMPASFEEAAAVASSTADSVEAAKVELDGRRTELEVARELLAERRLDEAAARNQREGLEGARDDAVAALEGARQVCADEDLEGSEADAEANHQTALTELAELESTLATMDAEGARARFENAEAVRGRLTAEFQGVEAEVLRLEGALEAHGSSGLHDRLNDAQERLDALEEEQGQLERLAAAAELLFTTMSGHRDAMKQSYVAPLREQIEGLGRTVFGPSLSVELDVDTLSISRRTLDGVTVDFSELSVGAREQLAIISRLAAARVVGRASSERGAGVPVIIDDALGSSDPRRLESLGVVFSLVAPDAQVIILTCVPDRYENIGSATVVHLEREARPAARATALAAPPAQRTTPAPSSDRADQGAPPPSPPVAELPAVEVPSSGPPAPAGGLTTEAARVLAVLGSATGPLGKSDILEQAKLGSGEWTGTINALLAAGRVLREGDKRGAKYRLAQ